MSGVTKHIAEQEKRNIISMWNKELKEINAILPQHYTSKDIVATLMRFYPHEWNSVVVKVEYYRIKEKHLERRGKKPRYEVEKPEKILESVSLYKSLMSCGTRERYAAAFDEQTRTQAEEVLWQKRKKKIERIDQKIKQAKQRTQVVTPDFIDAMIGLYNRKRTSQKDRVYILAELKKYYNIKIVRFLFKLNDTEVNEQLRDEAFYHLQSFGFQPRKRRQKYMQIHTKNRKRRWYLKNVYPKEKYDIPHNPDELEYRIKNAKEQKIKSYDYFISHSSKDSSSVQILIEHENGERKNVFCDWICDADYLKRHLLCEATLSVLKERLRQSKAILFVDSPNSRKSVWCRYELNFFASLKKPIYVISKKDIDTDNFHREYGLA